MVTSKQYTKGPIRNFKISSLLLICDINKNSKNFDIPHSEFQGFLIFFRNFPEANKTKPIFKLKKMMQSECWSDSPDSFDKKHQERHRRQI